MYTSISLNWTKQIWWLGLCGIGSILYHFPSSDIPSSDIKWRYTDPPSNMIRELDVLGEDSNSHTVYNDTRYNDSLWRIILCTHQSD